MDKTFEVVKTQVELYRIKHETSSWTNITLDYADQHGRITISSGYGTWSYYWGACSYSFKEFLVSLDMCYVANKFGEGDWFDLEATKNRMKKDVLESLENGDITEIESKELVEEMDQLFSDCDNEISYQSFVFNNSAFWKFYQEPSCFPLEKIISPYFRQFWNEPWTAFINELRKEISK